MSGLIGGVTNSQRSVVPLAVQEKNSSSIRIKTKAVWECFLVPQNTEKLDEEKGRRVGTSKLTR